MAKDKAVPGENSGTIRRIMKAIFPSYSETDNSNSAISFESGSGFSGAAVITNIDECAGDGTVGVEGKAQRDLIRDGKMPSDRFSRYRIYHQMSEDGTIAAALEQHLAYALSVDPVTGLSMYLEAKDEKDAEYVKRLQSEVVKPINDMIDSWAMPMCIYGVNYVRPYCVLGHGIVSWEANYYTLAKNIREYERAGLLAGFTSENLKTRNNGEQVNLAEPWALIPLKIPQWHPDLNTEPTTYGTDGYSLYSDINSRKPIETQNYGKSLLHSAYEPWVKLLDSIRSMQASRNNASRIDRLVSVSTDNLDTGMAAEYINLVADQLRTDREEASRNAERKGIFPTVWTSIIPVMSGGAKGGVSIDTHSVDPNIAHIEDIMFHVKRMCGSLGIDPAMLGFGDLLAGGLGEGGYFRTAIQAALRANLIRKAVTTFVMRAIDIHTAFRDGKVWQEGDEPFVLRFNSLNTAIAQEEAAAAESRVNYATLVVTLLDMLEQSSLSGSRTAKDYVYKSLLQFDPELTKEILDELANKVSDNKPLMESAGLVSHQKDKDYIKGMLFDALSEIDISGE